MRQVKVYNSEDELSESEEEREVKTSHVKTDREADDDVDDGSTLQWLVCFPCGLHPLYWKAFPNQFAT